MFNKFTTYGQRVATNRATELARPILNWFTPGQEMLDFGCGIGHLGYYISQKADQKLISLDVRKYPLSHPSIDPVLFDGRKIPYPDNAFDTTFVAYTLHHTISAKEVLQEIIRVTKRKVIISEDFLKTRKHIPIEVAKDILSNFFFAHITMQYRTVEEWEKMFGDLGLSNKKRVFHSSGKLLHFEHVSWLLEK